MVATMSAFGEPWAFARLATHASQKVLSVATPQEFRRLTAAFRQCRGPLVKSSRLGICSLKRISFRCRRYSMQSRKTAEARSALRKNGGWGRTYTRISVRWRLAVGNLPSSCSSGLRRRRIPAKHQSARAEAGISIHPARQYLIQGLASRTTPGVASAGHECLIEPE